MISNTIRFAAVVFLILVLNPAPAAPAEKPTICISADASFPEQLGAKEIRRYLYLRTGERLDISTSTVTAGKPRIELFTRERFKASHDLHPTIMADLDALSTNSYTIRPIRSLNRPQSPIGAFICGADDTGTLYGAYRFIEEFGVRFYLHGDSIPDEQIPLKMPDRVITDKPLFELRGVLPFHDFPEGPDWWTLDDWKGVVSQCAKMRMNFIGLHTYPKGSLGPEPTVWIGLKEDIGPDGKVRISDCTSWHNTQRYAEYGCYTPAKTSSFSFGAAELFETDDYGPEVMENEFPTPTTPARCNALMERVGAMLNETFTAAHKLGIRTCVGTETPIRVPENVEAHLRETGKMTGATTPTLELYEGVFARIMKAYPIDYYWLWTPEWAIDLPATKADLADAVAAADNVGAPFSLAVCGWGWLAREFANLDPILPRSVAFSCINDEVGNRVVDPLFKSVSDRPKWAIPWMEDDPGMISPQMWVGRIRKDAADALAYGCTGLMGLHWRTRILGPNIAALADAAWDQSAWRDTETSPPARSLPSDDFYADWARQEFGAKAGPAIAEVFSRIDSNHARASNWNRGPGVIQVTADPWTTVSLRYKFVDELAALRSRVKGPGNRERFDWWLNTFQYARSMAQLACARGELNAIIGSIDKETDAEKKRVLAETKALPLRRKLVRLAGEMMRHLLATVNNASEMGTVANIEQQSLLRTRLLTLHDEKLEKVLGRPLPSWSKPSKAYSGPFRVIVPTTRSSIGAGEDLRLKVIILSKNSVRRAVLQWRAIGEKPFIRIPFDHVARSVYRATIPATAIKGRDIEYHVRAENEDGSVKIFPPTAPGMNQAVIVEPGGNSEEADH